MSQVVIKFEGICVNFKQTDFSFLPAKHRIVLINASTITDVWDNTIFPHLAGFSVGEDPTVPTTPLTGAVVKISNPITDETQPGVTYDGFEPPSLTSLTPGLNPPSLAVLTGNNPDLVSCYFDIDFGVISTAGSELSGVATIVTIQTDGPPMYQVTPFQTGLSSSPLSEVEPQPAADQMFFSNEETDVSQASDNDFLLSYLVVDPPPATTPNIPQPLLGSVTNRKSELAKKLPKLPMNFTDVGCSNSAYP